MVATGEERPLHAEVIAPGGAKLADHQASGQVVAALRAARWDALVLQEQQQWPSFSKAQRLREMHPPARIFHIQGRSIGARTVLYMTAARRDGDTFNNPSDTYEAMHERVVEGYTELARDLGAEVAPVAVAWHSAHERRPELQLWAGDGYHPSPAGSYLAACVLFRTLYGRSPEGNTYTGTLAPDDAAFLQHMAATTPPLSFRE